MTTMTKRATTTPSTGHWHNGGEISVSCRFFVSIDSARTCYVSTPHVLLLFLEVFKSIGILVLAPLHLSRHDVAKTLTEIGERCSERHTLESLQRMLELLGKFYVDHASALPLVTCTKGNVRYTETREIRMTECCAIN